MLKRLACVVTSVALSFAIASPVSAHDWYGPHCNTWHGTNWLGHRTITSECTPGAPGTQQRVVGYCDPWVGQDHYIYGLWHSQNLSDSWASCAGDITWHNIQYR